MGYLCSILFWLGMTCGPQDAVSVYGFIRHEEWLHTSWHGGDLTLWRGNSVEYTYTASWVSSTVPHMPCDACLTVIWYEGERIIVRHISGDAAAVIPDGGTMFPAPGKRGIVLRVTSEWEWTPRMAVIAERCLNNPDRRVPGFQAFHGRLALRESIR